MTTDRALAPLQRARKALMDARTVPEVKAIHDDLEAALRWAKKRLDLSYETTSLAEEDLLQCKRRMGGMLDERDRQHGARPADTGSHGVTPPALADLGITKMQSSRFQALARIPNEIFSAWLKACREVELELTQAGLLRAVMEPGEELVLELSGAIDRLRQAVGRMRERWPADQVTIIPNILRSLADELESAEKDGLDAL